ncbi:LytR/AlgR family response regulator transcription factor [Fibrella aestuarina]|nr:LytTR family DNA-binding domain-containing protein [Fibrella aestuarina]
MNRPAPKRPNHEPMLHRRLPGSLRLLIGKKYQFVPISQIIYLRGNGNYTQLVTTSGQVTFGITLAKMGQRISGAHFVRVHRRHIVNLRYVVDWSGPQQLQLHNGMTIDISRRELVATKQAWVTYLRERQLAGLQPSGHAYCTRPLITSITLRPIGRHGN